MTNKQSRKHVKGFKQVKHLGSITNIDMRYTSEGKAIMTLTLANRTKGEHPRTAYREHVLFDDYAETMVNKLEVGQAVFSNGRLNQHRGSEGEVFNNIIVDSLLILNREGFAFEANKREQDVLQGGKNEVMLSGHLTKDAEFNVTTEQKLSVCNLRLAVNVADDQVIYLNATCQGEEAEMMKDAPKGTGVLVEGKLLTDSYEVKGERRYQDFIEVSGISTFGKA